MVFEMVFPRETLRNGFGSYMKTLAPESGLELIEVSGSATVVEGEWESAMDFLRRCQEYIFDHGFGPAVTTVHIHS
ncbi:MAG: hypothetical protein C4532_04395 [Candidatus Abyssobacteria bacterium SURF_17]|uniref:Thiamine-binding protein domain-containing protein n=1 Tax=Candidatus Abyssobacteria bacterium SURF_17 TaxID=2093361 RepID=A0A419F589_9BACT|nr:MAG: hypothetical protein C4532_04395 [Candidatus Abyssubacteria bacterium SURF_17]